MPRIPSVSPATGKATSSSYVHTTDCNFVDNTGRTLLLRGVNLSGSSKAPVGRQSQVLHGFWDTAEEGGESFQGRPLNLDDGSADVHLSRLRGWGFNMLRYPVTWESIEHEGPGKYDYNFMDYTVRVLRKCKEYGFRVYMDPHQDIWSRFCGGSGAPIWTLAACGIDPRNFTATQAAIVHCEYPAAHAPDPASLPAMIWSTNYGRLAAQTVFTLFFAGRDFAPKCVIDDENIQDWLQGHYLKAFGELAEKISDAGDLLEDCVIGWDSMNEPFEGLVGWENLNANPTQQGSTMKKGTYPTPAQSLRLGMGQAQTVDNWYFGALGPARDGTVTIDPKGYRIWADPSTEDDGVHPKWGWKRDPLWTLGTCLWAQHGVWDVESGFILRPDYFRFSPDSDEGAVAEFVDDYWRPHFLAFTKCIRAVHPEAIMFVQPPVFARPPTLEVDEIKGRCAYSGHYYDGLTLVTRHWNWFNADALGLLRGKYKSTLQAVKIGESAIRRSLQAQLGILKSDADILGPYPTIIGEIGTPFDMDSKRSYGWTDRGKYFGDYTNQQKALDASLNAADGANGLNWTVWTYCPDSSHMWGDGWNMEDLSLWSPDDMRANPLAMASTNTSKSKLLASKSRTSLLGRGGNIAATSTVSISTLPNVEEESDKSPIIPCESWKNPYAFLTDGARAVRAFSRPWPQAVVGIPSKIQFTISKAEFKLSVLVRAEDAPPTSAVPPSPSSTSGEKERSQATEIYLPIVHYAKDDYLANPKVKKEADFDEPPLSPTIGAAASLNRTSHESDDTSSSRRVSRIGMSLIQPSPTATLLTPVFPENLLDVKVSVSAGRYEIDGQMLKWWYPIPRESEPPVEYTITVTRGDGPIKATEEWAGGPRARNGFMGKFCRSLDSCCIM